MKSMTENAVKKTYVTKKRIKTSSGRMVFNIINYSLLTLVSLACMLPLLHVVAVSFSSPAPVAAAQVGLWPIGFTTAAYEFIITSGSFIRAFLNSIHLVVVGVILQMFITVVTAYPMAKEPHEFKSRNKYMWFLFFTTLFTGGLIPTYFVVKETGLLDTIWAVLLPGAVPVANIIVLLNFFRRLPKELEESAYLDGAGHFTILFKIFIPLSKPAIASLVLFSTVQLWNMWFQPMIYNNRMDNYPLQTYLQTLINPNATAQTLTTMSGDAEISLLEFLSNETAKAAQIVVTAIPILCAYPYLQRYFTKGLTLGSVKG